MTTLPPPPMMNSTSTTTQMSTPLSQLPLKTVSQDDTSDIDDPLIQGVLKEFEDSMPSTKPQQSMPMPAPQQVPMQQAMPMPSQPLQQPDKQFHIATNNLHFNNADTKKIIDIEIAKKAGIMTLIVIFLQYTNIFKFIIGKLPESVHPYINGKESFINILAIFIIIYALYYADVI